VWREQVRSDLTRVLAAVRPWHLALAERFVAHGWLSDREDYFLLTMEEVGRAVNEPAAAAQLKSIVARTRARLAQEKPLRLPLLMHESTLASQLADARVSGNPQPTAGDDRLHGLCVSPGAATAPVVVMRDPAEFAAMRPGAILVAPATDPSWTPLFTMAAGVIVEVGGMLSHASTVAREYGLPALANVKHATTVLKTGDFVRLEASSGYAERVR
jgi:pyruvate,water dikinase